MSFLFISGVYHGIAAQNPRQVLRRVIAKYESVSSYQDSGVVRVLPGNLAHRASSESFGFERVALGQDTLVTFKTYYTRPRSFRFDWNNPPHPPSQTSVIWSDGKQVYSWLPRQSLPKSGFFLSKESSLRSSIVEALGSTNGSIFIVPSLLIKDATYHSFGDIMKSMTDLTMLKEEKLDGETCHVIRARVSGVPWVLWVGKDSYLLRMTQTLYSGESFHEKAKSGASKTLIAEEIHSHIKINESISPEIFNYRPRISTNDVDLTR